MAERSQRLRDSTHPCVSDALMSLMSTSPPVFSLKGSGCKSTVVGECRSSDDAQTYSYCFLISKLLPKGKAHSTGRPSSVR